MRLRLLTVVGSLALGLAVPSAALAHHGRGHHHHHKAKAHHAKFRFEHIGANGVSGPTTTPSSPTTPSPPTTPANAGKVTSFEKEMLTITLGDGSTVSGTVTSETKIECVPATPATSAEPGDKSPGDEMGERDDQSRGDMSQGDQSEEGSQDDRQDGDDDDQEGAAEPPCDTSLLVPGTVVRSAELRIGPSGNEFENIVLVR